MLTVEMLILEATALTLLFLKINHNVTKKAAAKAYREGYQRGAQTLKQINDIIHGGEEKRTAIAARNKSKKKT